MPYPIAACRGGKPAGGGAAPAPWWLAGGVDPANCVGVYQALGAASYAASKVNLAKPGTNDLVDGVAPSWTKTTGWTFTYASGTYLITGLVPASGWSMIVSYSSATLPASNTWMVGVDSSGNARFYLSPLINTNTRMYGSGGYALLTGDRRNGIMAVAGQQPYYNGAADGSALAAWDTTQTKDIYIGALHAGAGAGVPSNYFAGKIGAVAIYNTTLTPQQVLAITYAMPQSSIMDYTIGGVNARILFPGSYDIINGAPLVMYHHGLNETYTSITDDATKTTTVAALLDAGYIVASSTAHGNNCGSQTALDDYSALYTFLRTNYKITRMAIWSASMGGISGLLTLLSVENCKGWLGTYPFCDLRWAYDNGFSSFIKADYGIAEDGSDYNTKTSGHDPLLLAGSAYAGKRMRFYASASDTAVSKAHNSDEMAALVNGYAIENTVVACSGNHGDASHFQPNDYVDFFNRCV